MTSSRKETLKEKEREKEEIEKEKLFKHANERESKRRKEEEKKSISLDDFSTFRFDKNYKIFAHYSMKI